MCDCDKPAIAVWRVERSKEDERRKVKVRRRVNLRSAVEGEEVKGEG